MCGRFAQIDSEDKVMSAFDVLQSEMILEPRYNICPSQRIPVIIQQNGFRTLEMREWGLIPFWAKEPNPMINARSETAAEKPSFRHAFMKRRCLIPASGFYEWAKEGRQKQPYFIRLKNESPMAFAGLWEEWLTPEGENRRTCAILTVVANSFMQKIHHRMPVILTPSSGALWLDLSGTGTSPEKLLLPFPSAKMEAWRVSRKVNSPAFDNPDCLKKLEVPETAEKKPKPPGAQATLFD
ncbi:MAG TPA: SOS response-associated peptidase [Deltaproteobacteria bacterium]|nr:SOS response-associated peptidase [Deltaproteobacteria bacterium]HIO11682.1 SOS response-associated peptidase [Deltaproteobacteria bacterium]